MLSELTHERLAAHVAQSFELRTEPPLELRLGAVTPRPGGAPGPGGREPFSLLFLGPREPVLPQRIYPLEHAELGRIDIFLVPVGPNAEGAMQYEAIFS